jgi:hypothetical protein
MEEQALLTTITSPNIAVNLVSQFRQEYLGKQTLSRIQASLVQRFLETQAAIMAEAIVQGLSQVRFSLPDRVVLDKQDNGAKTSMVPAEVREQMIGGLVGRLIHTDLRTTLRSRLMELEQSSNPVVSTSAILIRHALVMYMVYNMLPSGKGVQYTTLEGDVIPTIPLNDGSTSSSALTAASDAMIVEEDRAEGGREQLLVPYVEAARRFYLPQWVSFDDSGALLVQSLGEAENQIASMQRYLSILHHAVSLAPYMVADEEYQRKRYGILGQLVNQGRALAHFQVKGIIQTIRRRATSHDLDRGLSLSLPYFNDQTLMIEDYNFDVIPSGRVMFVPAFVVLAVRTQAAKVAQDTRMSLSTRRQILIELSSLEGEFLR